MKPGKETGATPTTTTTPTTAEREPYDKQTTTESLEPCDEETTTESLEPCDKQTTTESLEPYDKETSPEPCDEETDDPYNRHDSNIRIDFQEEAQEMASNQPIPVSCEEDGLAILSCKRNERINILWASYGTYSDTCQVRV